MNDKAIILSEQIGSRILTIRGQRVMLDSDLATLYGVPTKALNQAIKRNPDRFPPDFMFQTTEQEVSFLKSQIVTAKTEAHDGRGGRRSLPYAFTEHGAIMAASVLNSKQAVDVSIYVVRAFVQLREMLAGNKELAAKFAELETRVGKHDETIRSIVAAIRQLMQPPKPAGKKKIGFGND